MVLQEQLEFMKEIIIQVDEQDQIIGPISKKDCKYVCMIMTFSHSFMLSISSFS